jgi:integrase
MDAACLQETWCSLPQRVRQAARDGGAIPLAHGKMSMLSLRTRGKSKIYYIRGHVSLGGNTIEVKEVSTGTSDRDAAAQVKAELETRLRNKLLFGPAADIAAHTIADAFESYITKPKPPCAADLIRIGRLNKAIGNMALGDYREAWRDFRQEHLASHAPGGQDRYRSVLQAAINEHREQHGLERVKPKAIPFFNERVRWLTTEDRDLLISSYAPHVQPIITMLAFHGPRVQEALQMPWGSRGVDMAREAIMINHEKTAKIQWVPMHPRVKEVLLPIWEKRGRPTSGHVFLNMHGQPYQDTRRTKTPGGNPLKTAHATALKRSGIEDFTVHDWRHHWASQCVMAGIDLITIMHMGGWKSLRMVQRYSSVSVEHMRDAINRLK